MPIGAIIGGALPGLIQAGGSLFGAKKRKREQQAAQAQFDADQAAVRNFEFKNPYANLENTAEDLTVNQQATNVQAQQTDAALSQGLDAIVAGGGGAGGAQAIANAALGAKQNIAADIAGQESANQAAAAQQAAQNQQLEAQGAQTQQNQQFGQLQGNLDQSGQRLSAANAAQQQAKQALVSGLGSAVGGGLAAGGAGAKGAGFFKNLASGFQQANPVQKRSPLYNTEPKKRQYTGKDRWERQKLLKGFIESQGQTFKDLGGGRYNIGNNQVTIDPRTGEFAGAGARRAEEFLASRAQHMYDQDYQKALKEAGLQAGFDPRGASVNDADAALAESISREGGNLNDIAGARERRRDIDVGLGRTNAYSDSPTQKKTPLYKKKGGLAKLRAQCRAAGYKMVKMK